MINQEGTRKALLLGASGLVGSFCLEELLRSSHYQYIYAPTRSELSRTDKKLSNPICDFNNIDEEHEMFSMDDVYCCLGTTINKAKSKEAFLKVDFELVITLSDLARKGGAKRMAFISSVGASEKGSFYLRTKAMTEKALTELGFDSLNLIRPSLLLGDRKEKRLLEQISAQIFKNTGFIFNGLFAKYRPVEASKVAKFMVKTLENSKKGTFILESNVISKD
jgi:nucleoside-diphosphate-sugar epimerase